MPLPNLMLIPNSTNVVLNESDNDTPHLVNISDRITLTNISQYTNTTKSDSGTSETLANNICTENSMNEEYFWSSFGIHLAVPVWEAILTTFVLSVIIILTIVGNILVILSVFTYKPLRIVQNFFIVSLAVADLTVALLVLPFNVAYSILGRWEFGIHLCKMWLTCDVMCCTSSILNLCAIALDRYWAITDPINYAQKRTVGRVLLLISGVWILSLLISSPPLVGWNDWPEEFTNASPCELTSNRGYVIYSSLGSFFIPLAIMTIVYIEIYIATRRRLRERAKASKINTITIKNSDVASTVANGMGSTNKRRELKLLCANIFCCWKTSDRWMPGESAHHDRDSVSSEAHGNEESVTTNMQQIKYHTVVVTKQKKTRRAKIKDSLKKGRTRSRSRKDHRTNENVTSTALQDSAQPLTQPPATGTPMENVESQAAALNSNAIVNDDESTSLKITPPQSSTGAAYSMVIAPRKKSTGVYQFIEERQKISLSKERRAARTLGIIMGVFVICWLPFFLMYVILPFCESCCPTNKFKNFITWLGYINSGLNPVIYTIFNLDYRRAFKRLLGFD